ncbi:hypothetical protein [Rickettsia argasii]|uniref:Uncharacterized protein n=1 Tax=Rickettsia argasii T170-B TaxID=1268837 RepID=A0A0F3RF76_9RICK|nr:hypothetical protein [Rickettsia argasii]KJW04767.1 hypothetical protein RAT170B_1086 [Rickettsia argasii T170-B]
MIVCFLGSEFLLHVLSVLTSYFLSSNTPVLLGRFLLTSVISAFTKFCFSSLSTASFKKLDTGEFFEYIISKLRLVVSCFSKFRSGILICAFFVSIIGESLNLFSPKISRVCCVNSSTNF